MFTLLLTQALSGARPKPRKAAGEAVLAALKAAHAAKGRALGTEAGTAIVSIIKGGGAASERALPLAAAAAPLLPAPAATELARALLGIAGGRGGSAPRSAGPAFAALVTLCESPTARLPAAFSRELTLALVASLPLRGAPPEAVMQWSAALAAALARLTATERAARGLPAAAPTALFITAADAENADINTAPSPLLPGVGEALGPAIGALSRVFSEPVPRGVHAAAANAIAHALASTADSGRVAEALAWVEKGRQGPPPPLAAAADALTKNALDVRAQGAWEVSAPTIGVLFRVLGPAAAAHVGRGALDALIAVRGAVAAAVAEADAAAGAYNTDEDEEEAMVDDDRGVAAAAARKRARADNDSDGGESDGGARGARMAVHKHKQGGGGGGGGAETGLHRRPPARSAPTTQRSRQPLCRPASDGSARASDALPRYRTHAQRHGARSRQPQDAAAAAPDDSARKAEGGASGGSDGLVRLLAAQPGRLHAVKPRHGALF